MSISLLGKPQNQLIVCVCSLPWQEESSEPGRARWEWEASRAESRCVELEPFTLGELLLGWVGSPLPNGKGKGREEKGREGKKVKKREGKRRGKRS